MYSFSTNRSNQIGILLGKFLYVVGTVSTNRDPLKIESKIYVPLLEIIYRLKPISHLQI